MSTATHHVTAAVNIPVHVADFVSVGRGCITAMTNNPHFPSPTPSLATCTTAFDVLETAQTLALTRVKGAATARNARLAQAKNLILQLKAYVQSVADANPDQAAAIIESAGMSVRKTVIRQKQANEAKAVTSGIVDVFAVVVAYATAYEWQTGPDGKTWTNLPTTPKSRTTVTGLTPGQTYYFRNHPIVRKGAIDWSQAYWVIAK